MRQLKIIPEVLDSGHIALNKKIASKPLVGIWWYIGGEVYGVFQDPAECPQGRLVCSDYEHSRIFNSLQQELKDKIPEIEKVRFNQIERGRVWYAPETGFYMITCSTEISKNTEAINKIKNDYNLHGKMVEVRTDVQYDVFDILIK